MNEPALPAVAVVIPAFRAAASIGNVVERTLRAAPGATVLVVDDGSDDDTASLALAAGAAVASHELNRGKGRALATGLAAAMGLAGVTWAVTLDADGQHPPEAIPDLLAPLRNNEADLVVGARPRGGPMPAGRRFTNWLSSRLASRVTGQSIPDSQSGFRAMTRAVAERVQPNGARYDYETEFLFSAAAQGFRIGAVEIPVVYAGERSHFRYVADTLRLARVFIAQWRRIV